MIMSEKRYRKHKGAAGSHGVEYQQKLLTLFLIKAYEKNKIFQLSTENIEYGLFDDIVYESENENIYAQAKHMENIKKKLTLEMLNTPGGNFSVLKYLKSFFNLELQGIARLQSNIESISFDSKPYVLKEIETLRECCLSDFEKFINKKVEFKTNLEHEYYYNNDQFKQLMIHFFKDKKYILFSNLKFSEEFLELQHFNQDFILCKDGESFDYSIVRAEYILESLKNKIHLSKEENKTNLPDEENKINESHIIYFLKNFCFVSIDIEDINIIIRDVIRKTQIFQCHDLLLNKVEKNIETWFKEIRGIYLQHLDIKSYFADVWSDNMKQKLETYIKDINFSKNCKCILKDYLRNCSVLVIKTNRHFLLMIKLLQELNQTNKHLFVNTELDTALQVHMIRSFAHQKYVYLFCVLPDGNVNHRLDEIKDLLRKICSSKYKKIVLLSAKNILLDCIQKPEIIGDEELFANCVEFRIPKAIILQEEDKDEFYIPRLISVKGKGRLKEKEFLDVILKSDHRCFLLSDDAGMGKTSLLNHLAYMIHKQYKNLCAINIQINRYTDLLKSANEQNTFLKIENFPQFQYEDYFNQQVLTIPNSVVFMIDGIDEVSPRYTEIVLEFIKEILGQSNFKKVLVSTRPNVQNVLESFLNIEPSKLVEFSQEDQLNLIWKYWTSNWPITDIKRNECFKCCTKLVEYLNSSQKSSWKFMGIPLLTKMIAEISVKYCKQFLEDEELNISIDKKFNLAKLYDLFLERKQYVLIRKSNADGNEISRKVFNRCLKQVFKDSERMAMRYIFDVEKCNILGVKNADPSSCELLYSMGLMKCYSQKFAEHSYEFIHRTFAEYLVANLIWKRVTNREKATKEFLDFFIEEIIEDKFGLRTVRTLFNEIVSNNWNIVTEEVLTFCSSVIDVRIEQSYLINLFSLVEEGQLSTLTLILQKSQKCKKSINDNYNIFGKNALHLACNNLQILDFLYERGGDIEKMCNDTTGNKLMHITNDANVIKYIIGMGASIDAENKLGQTPLYLAIIKENIEIVDMLLTNKSDPNKKNIKGESPLHAAMYRRNLYVVERLIKFEAIVNVQDVDGVTPLHLVSSSNERLAKLLIENGMDIIGQDIDTKTVFYAAFQGCLDIAKVLVENGALVDMPDKRGRTALQYAASEGETEIVKYLIGNGADVNVKDTQKQTALHYATFNKHLDTVNCLIENGGSVNLEDEEGCSPLHNAMPCLDIAKILVENGAAINTQDKRGRTALQYAASKGKTEIVKFLIIMGADVNVKDAQKQTALHYATFYKHLDTVNCLIENGVLVNVEDEKGCTPLDNAMSCLDIAKVLVENGAPIDIPDKKGRVALQYAASKGKTEIVKFLIGKGADVNLKDAQKQTALHYATFNQRLDTVNCLIQNGALVNLEDEKGYTPLHNAMSCLDIAKILVENGAAINTQDKRGRTALQYAASKGKTEIVKFLIIMGADVNVKDAQKQTALHYATFNKNLDTVNCLIQNGALVNLEDEKGCTPLHNAMSCLDIANVLVENGAPVNVPDKKGRTALQYAASKGDTNIVKFLIEKGADVNIKDAQKQTALHYATFNKTLDTVNCLIQNGALVNLEDEKDCPHLDNAVSLCCFKRQN